MRKQSYRRSRKDYPKGVIGIYDNAGQTNESADHYLVVFEPIEIEEPAMRAVYGALRFPILSMSGEPFHPQGVCMHGEMPFRPTGGWQSGPSSAGKTINFADLPADCQRAVRQDLDSEEEPAACEFCGESGHLAGDHEDEDPLEEVASGLACSNHADRPDECPQAHVCDCGAALADHVSTTMHCPNRSGSFSANVATRTRFPNQYRSESA